MQSIQTFKYMVCSFPNKLFIDASFQRFMITNIVGDVASIQILSDNAKRFGKFIVKGIFISNNMRVLNTSQNSNFIQTVRKLFFVKTHYFHLFHGIKKTIFLSLDSVDCRKCSLTKFTVQTVLIHNVNKLFINNEYKKFPKLIESLNQLQFFS